MADIQVRKVSNTLTRWHKIGERGNERLGELNALISELVGVRGTTIDDAEADFTKAKNDFAKSEQLLAEREAVSRAICVIRTALAKANSELGIARLLAEIEHIKRTLAGLNAFTGNSRFGDIAKASVMVQRKQALIAELNSGVKDAKEPAALLDQVRRLRTEAINFFPVDEKKDEEIKSRIEGLRKEAIGLSDQLSNLNANHITIEIDAVAATSIVL